MVKAIRSFRLAVAGLAVTAAIVVSAGVGQAVNPEPASFGPADVTTGLLADYSLNHHGTAHWPRHTHLELGQ